MKAKSKKGGVKVLLNGNQAVQKTPGSKGVKSGVNPKAAASKVAKGRVGGTSKAPKKAEPCQELMAKQMLKRKDGSYSQRGLWDNIRAAKDSGKKPTAEMLKQEKKIKASTKKKG